jgi:hypothetical protein
MCSIKGQDAVTFQAGMAQSPAFYLFLCLQALQDEAENGERSWEKLQEVIGRLKASCPSMAGIIEEKCQDAHSRYARNAI